jgi:signal peptidase
MAPDTKTVVENSGSNRPNRTRVSRLLGAVATTVVVVAWVLWFRPAFLGGPASYVFVSGESMEPTYGNLDLVVLQKRETYEVGDVIAYRVPDGDPGADSLVIHRIVGGSATAGFITRGDGRTSPDLWRPTPRDVVGYVWVALPGAGRLVFVLRAPLVIATLAAAWVFLSIVLPRRSTARPRRVLRHGGRRSWRMELPFASRGMPR